MHVKNDGVSSSGYGAGAISGLQGGEAAQKNCSEVAEMARVGLAVIFYCTVALELWASALTVLFRSR